MAELNVKMGVSGVSQFIQSMNSAGASVKTIDAALKANEKELKATGDAATYMQQKSQLLNGKLKEQKKAIEDAQKALKTLKDNGTSEASKSFQDMQRRLLEAQSAMMDTEEQIRELGTASVEASGQTDKLADSLGGLNKKVSLEQVTSAISSITSGLEAAGRKAIELGKQIWENITDAARWGDDTATSASILNMSVEDYQRYKKVFDTVGDITVQEWAKMKQRVQNAIVKPTDEQNSIFALLGISTHETSTKIGWGSTRIVEGAAKDYETLFWEIGRRLREKVASKELTQAEADVYAQALFGKGFAELNPLLDLGEEGFNAALEEQRYLEEESVKKLASLNDKLIELENNFADLKNQALAELAPALEAAATALSGMLTSLLDYLQKPEGQQMLERLGTAVSGLFDDLKNIDPDDVVSNFVTLFENVIKSFEWLTEHWGDVKTALIGIAGGFSLLKISTIALNIGKAIDGFKGLFGGGGGEAAATGASSGGGQMSAWFSGLLEKFSGGMAVNNVLQMGQRVIDGLNDYISGLSAEEAQKKIFMHDLNLTESEYYGMMQGIQDSRDAKNVNPEVSGIVDVIASGVQEGIEVGLEDVDISTLLNAEDGAEQIQRQVGVVEIPANLSVGGIFSGGGGSPMYTYDEIGAGMSRIMRGLGFANGLPYVPFDGYHAILHKGERVVPAREVAASRNYSSNLYVESMYMNNGQDAAGLAAAMAAAQRRTSSGYGS